MHKNFRYNTEMIPPSPSFFLFISLSFHFSRSALPRSCFLLACRVGTSFVARAQRAAVNLQRRRRRRRWWRRKTKFNVMLTLQRLPVSSHFLVFDDWWEEKMVEELMEKVMKEEEVEDTIITWQPLPTCSFSRVLKVCTSARSFSPTCTLDFDHQRPLC